MDDSSLVFSSTTTCPAGLTTAGAIVLAVVMFSVGYLVARRRR